MIEQKDRETLESMGYTQCAERPFEKYCKHVKNTGGTDFTLEIWTINQEGKNNRHCKYSAMRSRLFPIPG